MSNHQLLASLNPAQADAAQTLSGPLLILAGAGSGKTKTLTHRIANLIQNGIAPHEILAVTFTNKAAREMRERVTKLVGSNIRFPYLGTFHGIAVRILKIEHTAANLDANFVIYDTDDQQALLKQLMKQLDYNPKTLKPKMVLGVISKCKNNGDTPVDYAKSAFYTQQKQIAKLYELYETAKSNCNALDFDDLLLRVAKLFSENAEVRQKWRDKIRHILVDEYQDTNHIQYQIIKLLVNPDQNICVVGDDWQSIYSWRGADFTNILNFERDFPGAKVVKLEQNYRSTGNILKASQTIINHNATRTDKNLFTDSADGEPVSIERTNDEAAEANFIARQIYQYICATRGPSLNYSTQNDFCQYQSDLTSVEITEKSANSPTFADIAILYRTNAQSYAFEKAFISARIPYKIIGGVRFYDRKEIKDVLAILKLIINPYDRISFERVVKNVLKGIGDASLQKILLCLSDDNPIIDPNILTVLPSRAATGLKVLLDFITVHQADASPSQTIQDAINHFSFDQLLEADPLTKQERLNNLEVLVGNAQSYQTLFDFVADAMLMSSADEDHSHNAVTLTTIHAAKGLEFPVVFLVGLEEGLFPSSQSETEEDIEEERRLAYVGMTRAMKKLTLTYACSRFTFQGRVSHEPSRFLLELGYNPCRSSSFVGCNQPEEGITDDFSSTDEFFDDFPEDDLPIYE